MEKIIEIPEGYEARIEGNKVVLGPKESEDERIRKYLIDVVNDYCKGSEYEGCIAYLEKQKEQKPVEKISVSEELFEHIRNACACIEDAMSSDTLCDMTDYLEMANSSAQKAFDMVERSVVKQPAEWSEDDKAMLLATIEYIQAYHVRLPSVVRWLKSLPERFNLHPKQEWSEEDEEMLRIISNRLDKFNEWATEQGFPIDDPTMKQSPIEWLKSRRPRLQWKPTDEQMEWLEQAVRLSANTLRTHDVILSLYNDLKKLM